MLTLRLKIDEEKAYRALEQHSWESDKALAQLSKEIISEKYTLYSKMFPVCDCSSYRMTAYCSSRIGFGWRIDPELSGL